MPLYEYQCDACGRRFERIQKFSDPPVEACPFCGGHVQKLISSPAFQFKGTGWYVTDYSRKDKGRDSGESGKSEAESKSADKGGEAKETTSSSDAKSDSKSTTGESSASKDAKPPSSTPSSKT